MAVDDRRVANTVCAGEYGYAVITDFATILKQPAIDNNHAFFAQDAWTVGHGLTLNLGIRIEKENLPVSEWRGSQRLPAPTAIHFSWSDKIEPRLGAAWGSRDGKLKIFGSYGVVNDVMKLLVAQTSWGAQGYEQLHLPTWSGCQRWVQCFRYHRDLRRMAGPARMAAPNTGANFAGGVVPPVVYRCRNRHFAD